MTSSPTEALASLKRQLAEENAAARALDAEVEAAEVELAAARDSLVRAYADEDQMAVKKATTARDKAQAHADEMALIQEAARLRMRRAGQSAQAYETGHASELIAELEPAALDVSHGTRNRALNPADRESLSRGRGDCVSYSHAPPKWPPSPPIGEGERPSAYSLGSGGEPGTGPGVVGVGGVGATGPGAGVSYLIL